MGWLIKILIAVALLYLIINSRIGFSCEDPVVDDCRTDVCIQIEALALSHPTHVQVIYGAHYGCRRNTNFMCAKKVIVYANFDYRVICFIKKNKEPTIKYVN